MGKPPCKKNSNTIIDMICNDNQYENDEERISDMLLYFAAGFDTTAHSLSWALLELAKNEIEQNKLRNALLEEYSSRRSESSSSFSDPSVVVEVAKSCPELKRVVREILRLHPAAPFGSFRQVGNSHVTYNVDEDDEGDGVDSENNKKKTKKMYI